VIQEKIFDVPKLVRNPEFEATIRTLGWDFLNGMVFDQANKTLTLEFYATTRFSGKKYESYARGKVIDYSSEAINRLLELTPHEQCDV